MPEATRIADDGSFRSVRITFRTAVLVVGVVLAVVVLRSAFASAHRILGWAAASVVVAVFVEPVVNWLGRFIPRVAAVLLTFVVIGVGIGALVFGTVRDLDREVGRLQESAPAAAARLEARDDDLGGVMRDLELSDRVDVFLAELDQRIGSGSGTLAQNAPTVPIYFVSAILTIFLLVYGPGMVRGAAEQIDDEHRRRVVLATVHDAAERARRTVTAFLAQGLVVGFLVWAAATVLDLPAPIVLGLVGGVAAMVPDFGILLGVLPTVALAAGLDEGRGGVVVLAIAFVLQMFEALWVRTWVDRWGVAVGPTVVVVVALVGYTLYGPGMAFYGVAYAIFGVAVLDRVPDVRRRVDAGPADT